MAKVGNITNVNVKTFTCSIISSDQQTIKNDVALPGKFDLMGGAHSIQLPNDGAPCLYETIDGATYILNTYFPVNYSPTEDLNGATINRRPGDLTVGDLVQGDSVTINATGGKDSFTGAMKEIVLSPDKLSSIWNLTNCIWSNICNVFKLSASGFRVEAGSGEGGECTTVISFSKSVSSGPDVVIQVGQGPNDIEVTVEGEQVLHIDSSRNVTLHGNNVSAEFNNVSINANAVSISVADKTSIVCPTVDVKSSTIDIGASLLDMYGANIKLSGSTIDVVADTVDFTACGAVKLP